MVTSRQIARFVSSGRARLARITGVWIRFEDEHSPADAELILRELHTLKGEAALYQLGGVVEHVHELESAVKIATGEGTWTEEASEAILNDIDSLIQELAELENAPWDDLDEQDSEQSETVTEPPVEHELEAKEESTTAPSPPARVATVASVRTDGIRLASRDGARIPTNQRIKQAARSSEESGVFIDAKLVDHIRDVVGDLMLTKTRLVKSLAAMAPVHRNDPNFTALSDELQRVTALVDQLEEVARDVRMLKTSSLFEQFPRMVRTLARDLGKRVRLRVEGTSINVDRDVLEALSQPLVHLVRNAVDHGIESPDDRLRSEKPETGQVSLEAEIKGSTVEIRVSDDGKGLDPAGICKRAIDLGLLDPAQADGLSEGEKLNLIFVPGMTTRDEASEVSGRGVGLDVVRENLAAVGGTIAIATSPGLGSTFTLRAPISFALSKVVMFRVGESHYAVNSAAVHGVVDASDYEKITDAGGAKLRYAGSFIPLVSLGAALAETLDYDNQRYLVCDIGGGLVALSDSREHELREAVLMPLDALQRRRHPVSAGFMLEDGSIALILNLSELELSIAVTESAGRVQRQRVLLVDDSQLIRELLSDVFRQHGFEVLEAENGMRALEILKGESGIQLLVTDIEMPEMNGFELLESLRDVPGLANLPKIVVSTRSSAIDRKMALERGASDYLVKADFSNQALWSRVEKLIGQ